MTSEREGFGWPVFLPNLRPHDNGWHRNPRFRQILGQHISSDGPSHPVRTAGPVIDQIGPGSNCIGDRKEHQAGHKLHNVPRCEGLPGFFIVFLIESPYLFIEDRSHAVVVHPFQAHGTIPVLIWLGTEVDRSV